MTVEFLRAWEDGTWDTQIVEVPEAELLDRRSNAGDDDWTLQSWARTHLGDQAQYRRVVCWALYAVYDTCDECGQGPEGEPSRAHGAACSLHPDSEVRA